MARGTVAVPDENGVIWAVAPEDIKGWVGHKDYAIIQEGAHRIKVLDPNFVHERRDFSRKNPHGQYLPYDQEIDGPDRGVSRRVNPLWSEWESSKRMYDLMGRAAMAMFLVIGVLIVALVISAL
jgi:hypothetical protein